MRGKTSAGLINLGDLRRLEPISREWGFDRGLPVDRHYIERFLAAHATDIRGQVLEIGDDSYTRQFGTPARITRVDVLNFRAGDPKTTLVADLADAAHIPSNTFDCIIFTQTLQFIFNAGAALQTIERILKPGGVVLATFPGISHIGDRQWSASWCWSFTRHCAGMLFGHAFPGGAVDVSAKGNVLASTAFLQGLSAQELTPAELDHVDPAYELVVMVRAQKALLTDAGQMQ
ncbi:MAG: methyltransferase domain-containing protein [Pseudomonadota bacterium]